MVSSHTSAEVFKKLREDEENRSCFDCSDIDITHASVNLGILLCRDCAEKHKDLGIEISCIVPLNSSWTARHLKLMTAGGNASLKVFFGMYSIPCNSANDYKYRTIACEYYREMLKMMAEGDRIMMDTPSEDEGVMLMEEYRPESSTNELRPESEAKESSENPKGVIDYIKDTTISSLDGIRSSSKSHLDKIRDAGTLNAVKDFASGAMEIFGKGLMWSAQKGRESLEWSAQKSRESIEWSAKRGRQSLEWSAQKSRESIEWSASKGKVLINQISNTDTLIDRANKVYAKIQSDLALSKLKQETSSPLNGLEKNPLEENKAN
jgi:Putative GTPase activating protein for Arf